MSLFSFLQKVTATLAIAAFVVLTASVGLSHDDASSSADDASSSADDGSSSADDGSSSADDGSSSGEDASSSELS